MFLTRRQFMKASAGT
ncbi:MAG: hypothetical protein DME36_14145, partial [Verrucomicrobia bacterium]